MAIISATDVSKSYGSIDALHSFSLEVPEGSIFGLLGPNGAGKTTFVKILLDLVHPSSGNVSLCGLPTLDPRARATVGYLPEKYSFYPYYTVQGTVEFYAQMQGLTKASMKPAVDVALEKAGLSELRKRKLSQLSKGQLQRIGIANLLLCPHQLLILDEPFSGLDPIGIKEFKDLMFELRKEGRTLFINSHGLAEVEQLCDEVCILNKGRKLAQGKVKDLTNGQSLEDFFYSKVKGD
ncbi:MAG: multidrug ABC transporter ATP-binding protein [Bdellovibrio sp. CG12_big_fil_rev_8_21_14_0_65_39_13]|nr:MAG: multidrug ABC transporter ATP-binding protein [Bdellovibrio sp. CG22_combo_CG10-13_8_21_14_all_39_27]PIQ58874.1 MAG: multidrug ABC transporter ATP-binding protein [Bdellovibrio sp. CG12_big_fil_rev_8_21_14_0_65_39_13]PIR35965.1 MAG: multidrug ABC transporter ATP-binding protein [Bdellovibrio sp. CG11_big_fil_rev_8_21_14_0_20_39_38]